MDTIQKRCYKNLLVLSVGWFLFYLSFSSIRNITSSINHKDGLGLYSMAGTYAGYMLACCVTTSVVRRYTTKWVLVLSLAVQIVFVVANLSEQLCILVPISVICGASQAAMWTAGSSYIVDLAVQLEAVTVLQPRGLPSSLKGRLFGVFFFFGSLAPVIGALMTSLILSKNSAMEHYTISGATESEHNNTYRINLTNHRLQQLSSNASSLSSASNSSVNSYRRYEDMTSMCGPNFCHENFDDYNNKSVISANTRLVLFGVYVLCMAIALLGFGFLLDGSKCLKEVLCARQEFRVFISDVREAFKVIVDFNFLLVSPLILFHGMQTAFFSGEVTKAFAGCLYGVDTIGYFVAVYGTSAAFTACVTGFASKLVRRTFLLSTAAIVNMFALVAMKIWTAESGDMLYVFALAFLWGVGEGIWATHLNSLVGALYVQKTEAAYSAFNMVLALGLTTGFIYSNYVCMYVKLYVTGVLCLVGISGYFLFVQRKHVYSAREDIITVTYDADRDVMEITPLHTSRPTEHDEG